MQGQEHWVNLGPESDVVIVGLCRMLGEDRIIYLVPTVFPTWSSHILLCVPSVHQVQMYHIS